MALRSVVKNDSHADRIQILLVEDQPGFALAISADLKRKATFDVAVAEARWLVEALERLSPSTDIVLLDLELPDSYGLDTLTAVRKHSPDVPIIVLTGN